MTDTIFVTGLVVHALQPVQKFVGLQSWSQNLLGPRITGLNRLLIRALELIMMARVVEY